MSLQLPRLLIAIASVLAGAMQATCTVSPAFAAEPIEVTPARAGLGSQSNDLSQLQSLISHERANLELLQIRSQSQDLLRSVSGTSTGTADVPALVGLKGVGEDLVAEFLAGTSIVQARSGDFINRDWRLVRIVANGVELRKADGSATLNLVFGAADRELTHQTMRPGMSLSPGVIPGSVVRPPADLLQPPMGAESSGTAFPVGRPPSQNAPRPIGGGGAP